MPGKIKDFTISSLYINWDEFERKGAIYIPYAGFRSGTTIYDVGSEAWIAASSGDARIGVLF